MVGRRTDECQLGYSPIDPKQLFIHSDWEPSPANILIKFQACVSHFLKHLRDQFYRLVFANLVAPFDHKG
jgi:hypothetical protein